MGQTTEDLMVIAQLRKALAPLTNLIKREADAVFEDRLDRIEKALDALLQKDIATFHPNITVESPDVNVNVDTGEIEKVVSKLQKSEPQSITMPSAYEPHDQAKKGMFNYSGFIKSDGEWYIQRVTKGEQRYAKGSGGYAKAWEKLTDLKYGYLNDQ